MLADSIPKEETPPGDSISSALDTKFSAEEQDLVISQTTPSQRKRRGRNKRPCTVNPVEGEESAVTENERLVTLHQPFHRVIFDDDGNASEVVLRSSDVYRVNRKHQKRLATSNYRWNSDNRLDSSVVGILPITELPSAATYVEEQPDTNLEVRRHYFSNDYETVVNYWYTTLEWLDKEAMGNIDQQVEENEDEGEIDKEEYSDYVTEGGSEKETCGDNKEVNQPSPENILKTETEVKDEQGNIRQ